MSLRWTGVVSCDSGGCDTQGIAAYELTYEREISVNVPPGWKMRCYGNDDSQRDINAVDVQGGRYYTYCPEHANER